MNPLNYLIEFRLKLKHNRWAFAALFIFWLIGLTFYAIVEENKPFIEILLISLEIRNPSSASSSDFNAFYQLIWPILLEVIVFGFLITALLEKYNPVVTSKLLAKHNSNHTIVIGYHHLGDRIVEYLQKNKKPYSLLEDDEELVENLIKMGEPVVVGDYTDDHNLKLAGISKAKEVFICSNDPRESIVVSEKVREFNKKCKLYVRVYGDYFQKYLAEPPINAVPFSTSAWAMDSVKEWAQNMEGDVLVLGKDHLAQKITEFMAKNQNRHTYLIDPYLDVDLYDGIKNISIIKDNAERIRFLTDHVDFQKLSQVFICWKEENEFSDSMNLAVEFYEKYPEIKLYIRIFDEELARIMDRINVTTFSTSVFAFEKLQKVVDKSSSLYEKQ